MGKQEPEEGKRVTVLFNLQDWQAIQAECERRAADRGYPVTVSDALRELVRENWSKPNESA